MNSQPTNEAMRRSWPAVVACSFLLMCFAVLSYTAVLTKSPTIDEPVEALGGWAQWHLRDFRMNFEHPPLWHYVTALPNSRNAIQFNQQDEAWVQMPIESTNQLAFAKRTLFQTPGNDGAAFINRSRFVMLLLGVGTGVLIAVWAWLLAGPTAAIIATALFSLDPNLIGHASLVKNDVAMALVTTAVFFVAWRVGKKATFRNVSALALLVAVAVNVKFSAVLIAPMLFLLLAFRAVVPHSWQFNKLSLPSRLAKTAASLLMLLTVAVASVLGIWTCYGFRFNPSPDPAVQINRAAIRDILLSNQIQRRRPPPVTPWFDTTLPLAQQLRGLSEGILAFRQEAEAYRAIVLHQDAIGNTHGEFLTTLPQAAKLEEDAIRLEAVGREFVAAIPPERRAEKLTDQQFRMSLALFNMSSTLRGNAWSMQLHGDLAQISSQTSGSWITTAINFMIDHRLLPSAWLNGLLKVYAESIFRGSFLMGRLSGEGWWYYFPLAILFKTTVAGIVALFLALVAGITMVIQGRPFTRTWLNWSLACLFVPFGTYLATALTTSSNIGWRYLIPLYPVMYVTAGVLLSLAMRRWRTVLLPAFASLGLLLAIETVLAWPNYIAYFNFPAGGSRGGLHLLSDSNLDWGQDLPLLSRWQRDHPNDRLALNYFGNVTVDPAYYGIKAAPLTSGYPDPQISRDHVLAISATRIQNPYRDGYDVYQQFKPVEVLGGTIFLYDLRPKGDAN